MSLNLRLQAMEKVPFLDKEHWQEERRHKNKTKKKLAEKALKYKLKVKEQRKLIKDNKSPKSNSSQTPERPDKHKEASCSRDSSDAYIFVVSC